MEDEVLANLRSQPIGEKTIGELGYPEPFLRRVADRVICESFERRFRIVVDEEEKPASQPSTSPASAPTSPISSANLVVVPASVAQLEAPRAILASNRSFAPIGTGFRLATECGESAMSGFRLQLTRATDWAGSGDGGALDVARQLLSRFDLPTSVHFESRFLPDLESFAALACNARKSQLTLLPQNEIVAQWAQDNAKFGWLPGASNKSEPAWLLPRFATRGDIGGTDITGETRAAERIAAAGAKIVRSQLLFQGGNLICVRDPKQGGRTLLIGEAEIARNLQWGWSEKEIVEAFRVEMGVDRCVVLPAASYHIDLEFSVRVIGDRVVAFVADTEEGRNLVLNAGIAALRKTGLLAENSAAAATKALSERRARDFMNVVGPIVMGHALEFGAYPKSLADKFSTSVVDSDVGNFLVFLHAMDSLLALSLQPDEVPQDRPGGYLRAIRRGEEARATLQKQLSESGFEIVKVPAISNGDRGVNPINCIQADRQILVPVWGGLFANFDESAIAAYRKAVGPMVEIVPILTSETQRRGGGLHCAASAMFVQ